MNEDNSGLYPILDDENGLLRFHGSVKRDATNEAALQSLIDAAYTHIEARVENG